MPGAHKPTRARAGQATSQSASLGEYERKRRFSQTPEPGGDLAPADAPAGPPRFVIHEHHARRLHWDLRLEHDGALASWAVPNGIPEDPKRNRKAIHVEDHPLEYIDFQGTIPDGNYGAGEISVWDTGTYTQEKWRKDEVILVFHGERLQGRYALFQAGKEDRDWLMHRMDPPADPTAEEMPAFIEPMLASPAQLPADDSGWAFEVKWDGVRAIAHSQPGRVSFLSRNRNEITAAYPELRALNRALGSTEAMLDGEIVAFDESGRPSFQALQPRMHQRGEAAIKRLSQSVPVTYVIYDLLWLGGHSLTSLPYSERRRRLDDLKLEGPHWIISEAHEGQGQALLDATREQGLEGVIGKRLDSRYLPGKRSSAWIKVKHFQRQEFVICGWTSGQGSRSGSIGALHLGVYEAGELHYVGRVGTGFDTAERDRLEQLLKPLARPSSPFPGRQPPKGAHFVEPILVCEVEFSEWTHAGTVRQASYKGLRDDKPAGAVARERPQAVKVDEHDLTDGASGESAGERERASTRAAARRSAKSTGAAKAPTSQSSSEKTRAAAFDLDALVEAGTRVRTGVQVELEGRELKLTNLDKVLYPGTGFAKRDLITYYASVAPVLLPHLHDRPLTLKRYPDGVDGQFFYEKRSPKHRPDWVTTTPVSSERERGNIDYTLCQDLPTLVWLANLADIELHPLLAHAGAIEQPASLVFDLDPGAPADLVQCCEVALRIRDLLDQLGLRAFPKTSGSKGIQVYAPLNSKARYEQTKPFAHAVANLLSQRDPDLVVSDMAKAKRGGKVLIDWSQNDEHKTTVGVYSLRATQAPGISTPLDWAEVEACRKAGRPELLTFGPADLMSRIMQKGDLFCDVLSLKQTLPELEG
jgi:bifunctional non-homologous end joining protein LigD